MRRSFQKLGAGVLILAAVLTVGFLVWEHGTTPPTPWVVSEVRDNQQTLVVAFGSVDACAQPPSLSVEQSTTEIRIRTKYRLPRRWGSVCRLRGPRTFPSRVVRLDQPLAGRQIVGNGQESLPVPWHPPSMGPPKMPGLIGMDAAAARRALSYAGYYGEANFPPANTAGFITRQTPLRGAQIRHVAGPRYGSVAAPGPRLTFSR